MILESYLYEYKITNNKTKNNIRKDIMAMSRKYLEGIICACFYEFWEDRTNVCSKEVYLKNFESKCTENTISKTMYKVPGKINREDIILCNNPYSSTGLIITHEEIHWKSDKSEGHRKLCELDYARCESSLFSSHVEIDFKDVNFINIGSMGLKKENESFVTGIKKLVSFFNDYDFNEKDEELANIFSLAFQSYSKPFEQRYLRGVVSTLKTSSIEKLADRFKAPSTDFTNIVAWCHSPIEMCITNEYITLRKDHNDITYDVIKLSDIESIDSVIKDEKGRYSDNLVPTWNLKITTKDQKEHLFKKETTYEKDLCIAFAKAFNQFGDFLYEYY